MHDASTFFENFKIPKSDLDQNFKIRDTKFFETGFTDICARSSETSDFGALNRIFSIFGSDFRHFTEKFPTF